MGEESEREKIRREYKELIRRHRMEEPEQSETLYEIETHAKIAKMEEGRKMHELYEEARYSEED